MLTQGLSLVYDPDITFILQTISVYESGLTGHPDLVAQLFSTLKYKQTAAQLPSINFCQTTPH